MLSGGDQYVRTIRAPGWRAECADGATHVVEFFALANFGELVPVAVRLDGRAFDVRHSVGFVRLVPPPGYCELPSEGRTPAAGNCDAYSDAIAGGGWRVRWADGARVSPVPFFLQPRGRVGPVAVVLLVDGATARADSLPGFVDLVRPGRQVETIGSMGDLFSVPGEVGR